MDTEQQRFLGLSILAGKAFSPNTPLSVKDLFSGRINQIRRVIDVIYQNGQHVIIFGERGVGKTSLANVTSAFIQNPDSSNPVHVTKINCDRQDNFASVWKKVFDEMHLTTTQLAMGFNKEQKSVQLSFFNNNSEVTPDSIRKILTGLGNSFSPVIIIDEFDRMPEIERKIFADLIKTLSDYSLNTTIILIGVGDSVDDIIHEHQSISRALVQVQMPRMNEDEVKDIVNKGLKMLGMEITDKALGQIIMLSKGFPHYAHLISLHASRDALDNKSMVVDMENVKTAITKAIEDAQHSTKTSYHNAINSARKDNLFGQVLLACALANANELGEFAAQDVREPMQKITGKLYEIPAFAQHLTEFSDKKRGGVLFKSGEPRRYKYKFSDPLMQSYVIMKGIMDNKITFDDLMKNKSIPFGMDLN